MASATVRSKGRLTLPPKVRQALTLKSGDSVDFVELVKGEFLVVASLRSITDLKGMFGRPGKAISVEEMNRAASGTGPTGS